MMQWTVSFLSIQHRSTDISGSWAVSGVPHLESLLVHISAPLCKFGMTPTGWFRGDEKPHLVSLKTKQLQQSQPSPEPKPQGKFCTEFAAPIPACLPLTTDGVSTSHLSWHQYTKPAAGFLS